MFLDRKSVPGGTRRKKKLYPNVHLKVEGRGRERLTT